MHKNFFSRLKKSDFLKNSFFLTLTTLLAQAIPLLATPLLTRLYTPQQYGYLTIFISLNSILFVIASGRYEIAIMLPKLRSVAKNLVQLSIILAVIISIVIFIIIVALYPSIKSFMKEDIGWVLLLPFSVFFMSAYRAYMMWCNREKKYKHIAVSKILQYGLAALLQIIFGYLFLSNGLIIGYTLGVALSAIYYTFILKREIDSSVSIPRVKLVARKYSMFPKVSMLGALANSLAPQTSIFLLTYYFSDDIVGQFGLANKIIYAPLLLVTSSISFIIFQRISTLNIENKALIKPFLVKGVFFAFCFFLPLIPIIYFFGESIFEVVFGKQWKVAGELAFYLSIAAVVKFSVSPFSTILSLDHNVKIGTTWQYIYLISSIIFLTIAANYNIKIFITVFAIHEVILYLMYFLFIYYGSTMRNAT